MFSDQLASGFGVSFKIRLYQNMIAKFTGFQILKNARCVFGMRTQWHETKQTNKQTQIIS